MPNGKELVNELDFEKQIKEMDDRGLLEFTARQVYETCEITKKHSGRIKTLEDGSKKISTISGSISGGLTAAMIAVADYIMRR